jgi:alpha-beta hydrolase superfamily lysophospholipase
LENKTRVFHRCWFPDKYNALVVGVHGFVEHGGRYISLGETLSHLNYAFCIHDLRGHGKLLAITTEVLFMNSRISSTICITT